jgi:hypothetical protein
MERLRKPKLLDEHEDARHPRPEGVAGSADGSWPSSDRVASSAGTFEADEIPPRPATPKRSWRMAASWVRRRSARRQRQRHAAPMRPAILSSLRAWSGFKEEIERDGPLRELMGQLRIDERALFILKQAGYSSEEIATVRGVPVGAVEVMYARVKRSIRRLAGAFE